MLTRCRQHNRQLSVLIVDARALLVTWPTTIRRSMLVLPWLAGAPKSNANHRNEAETLDSGTGRWSQLGRKVSALDTDEMALSAV